MILNYDKNTGEVNWYNPIQTYEQAQHRLNDNTIWIDADIPAVEDKEGYEPQLYYTDGALHWEYGSTTDSELTQLDRIEQNTQALMQSESALDVLLGVSE